MIKLRHKLTVLQVAKTKEPGRYADGGSLYLNVKESGHKGWLFRCNGTWIGLGSCDQYSLADARERAEAARQLHKAGTPVRIPQGPADRALKVLTFEQAARQFLSTEIVSQFKSETHRKQWHSTLETAYSTLGPLPLQSIDSALVLQTLLPIWKKTPETGSRLRQRIERVFAWSKAHKLFSGENPASRDVLRDALPAKPKADHHKAIPFAQLPAFMTKLRAVDSMSALALEFTILTAARTGEVIGATWTEIDLEARTWTIPAGRMKAGQEHVVPLCDRAVAILTSFPRSSEWIFGNGRPLSNMTMLKTVKSVAGNGFTTHGFRSCFRDWAGDQTAYAHEVIEFALAHQIPDKASASYRRYRAIEKRRELMSDWGAYCGA